MKRTRVSIQEVIHFLTSSNYSDSTIERYGQVSQEFLTHNKGYLNQSLVDQYLKTKEGCPAGTYNSVLSAIRGISNMVGVDIILPTYGKSEITNTLRKEDISLLLSNLPLPYNLMAGLLYSGLKGTEVVNLTTDDVLETGIRVLDVVIAIEPILLGRLQIAQQYALLDPNRILLFTHDGNNPICTDTLNKTIKSKAIDLGLPKCNTNVIRNSFAIHALEYGHEPSKVMEAMGITCIKSYKKRVKQVAKG